MIKTNKLTAPSVVNKTRTKVHLELIPLTGRYSLPRVDCQCNERRSICRSTVTGQFYPCDRATSFERHQRAQDKLKIANLIKELAR
jgi:bisphosphoglycerate-independent phosphoglycerate mutase (AlkP superfamily)